MGIAARIEQGVRQYHIFLAGEVRVSWWKAAGQRQEIGETSEDMGQGNDPEASLRCGPWNHDSPITENLALPWMSLHLSSEPHLDIAA